MFFLQKKTHKKPGVREEKQTNREMNHGAQIVIIQAGGIEES
jgi:hypothetical protein